MVTTSQLDLHGSQFVTLTHSTEFKDFSRT